MAIVMRPHASHPSHVPDFQSIQPGARNQHGRGPAVRRWPEGLADIDSGETAAEWIVNRW
jgi:hypothetical protein